MYFYFFIYITKHAYINTHSYKLLCTCKYTYLGYGAGCERIALKINYAK